jgi:hypothetical protein
MKKHTKNSGTKISFAACILLLVIAGVASPSAASRLPSPPILPP